MKLSIGNLAGIISGQAKSLQMKSSAQRGGASKEKIQQDFIRAFQMQKLSRGFTLIELLVSIGIFAIITTVAVVNQSNFNGSILLTNLAYEIGLSIREAQVYGITVKGTTLDATKFDSGYGMRFDMSTPTKYYLFEDRTPPDHFCDSTECGTGYANVVDTFSINRGNRISKICVDGDCSTPTILDISFVRPNPDAYIRINGGGGSYGKAEICVLSPASDTKRKVTVESTGQISVSSDAGAVCN